nr:MAG TPA: Cas system-associated protein [Caudoviricetes sp.]
MAKKGSIRYPSGLTQPSGHVCGACCPLDTATHSQF